MADIIDFAARISARETQNEHEARAQEEATRAIKAAGEALEPLYGMDASECVLIVAMDMMDKRLGRAALRDALRGHASCLTDDPGAA